MFVFVVAGCRFRCRVSVAIGRCSLSVVFLFVVCCVGFCCFAVRRCSLFVVR